MGGFTRYFYDVQFIHLLMEVNDSLDIDRECSENEIKGVVYTVLSLLGGLIFLGTTLIVIII